MNDPVLDPNLFEELPNGYQKWSSTVILFQEDSDSVHAFATATARLNKPTYFVVSYERHKCLRGRLGYTAGDRKLYFVGDAIDNDDDDSVCLSYLHEIKVYDIPNRKWMDNIPKLKAPMPDPILFFIDHRLYVLSNGASYSQSHFEMLNMSDLAKGWVSQPSKRVFHQHYNQIIDYSKETLYVRVPDFLYGFSLKNQTWYEYPCRTPLTTRTFNLLMEYWSNDSVLIENHLYTFYMYESSAGTRVVLLIRDLEEVPKNVVEQEICEVDISRIVHPDVLKDASAVGSLLYLGKNGDSCRSFFLAILHTNEQHDVVSTCTFDLSEDVSTNKFNVQKSSRLRKPLNLSLLPLKCELLCEVKDD